MSTPKNRIVRTDSNGKSVFPDAQALHSSTTSYNQGDLLMLDTTNHVVKTLVAEGDALTFLGIAEKTVVLGKLKYPYTTDIDASTGLSDLIGPQYNVVAKLILKTGDTLNPGDLVYADPATGLQNVQAAGTKAIGVYQGATVTASAGQEVEVLLGTRYPADALKF